MPAVYREAIMRILPALVVGLTLAAAGLSQEGGEDKSLRRYGVDLNLKRFPQATPQEALQSVLKTLESRKIFYLVAHLADPKYIDEQVREQKKQVGRKGKEADRDLVAFDRVVQDITRHLREDPSLVRDLQRLGREAEWDVGADKATARHKGAGRRALFRKIGERWFLENKQE